MIKRNFIKVAAIIMALTVVGCGKKANTSTTTINATTGIDVVKETQATTSSVVNATVTTKVGD